MKLQVWQVLFDSMISYHTCDKRYSLSHIIFMPHTHNESSKRRLGTHIDVHLIGVF